MSKIKIISIIFLVVLVGGAGFATYAYKNKSDTTSRTSPNQGSEEDGKKNTKDESPEPVAEKTKTPNKSSPASNEADERAKQEAAGNANTTTIKVIDTYQTDSELGIRLDIGRLKSGSCSASVKRGSKTVSKEANIALVTSYYACQGFSVPLSELSPGKWTVTASAISGGQTYKSAPVEVTIK